MSFKFVAGAGTVTALLGALGLTVASSRQNMESVHIRLNEECEKIYDEMRAIEAESQSDAVRLRQKKQETKDMLETVDTLWVDRVKRYKQTNLEMYSYITALPEALGALKGLANHYRAMTTDMRKFVAFDIAASKIHQLGMMLAHAEVAGIGSVAGTLQKMFAAEQLVVEVCESVLRDAATNDCPASITDASTSFVFCMSELDEAAKQATGRFLERSEVRTKSANVVLEGTRKLLEEAKVNPLSTSEIVLAYKKAELEQLLVSDRRQLRTREDVLTALNYVDSVVNLLRTKEDAKIPNHAAPTAGASGAGSQTKSSGGWSSWWVKVHSSNPAIVVKQGAGAADAADNNSALVAFLRTDTEVAKAREQLLQWRNWAAVYLMQEQAKDALNAYQTLLSQTLTKVNEIQ